MLASQRICVRIIVLLAIGVTIRGVYAFLPEEERLWSESETFPRSIQMECSARCPELDLNQSRTDDSSLDAVGCGVRCRIDQCTKGCVMWQSALELERSCQEICNVTEVLLSQKVLYCVFGCHDALNRYFHQLKAEIGTPPAPALVADSLTATSLRLEWKGINVKKRGGISYLVQWRYEELAETWQYCRNQSWGEDDQILVDNLQPYTKYRFRVALLLKSKQHDPKPIVSAPSVPILTSAAGLPSSAPVIVRTAAVDSCRVSISWEPGPFPNGPLLSYVLKLQGAGYSQLKDIPASENSDHYMFRNLRPNATYEINLTMRNSVGEGPPAVIKITTTPEPAIKDEQLPILILGGSHTVMKQGANMFDAPSLIYETSNTILGVAIHVASAQVFVSDSGGYIRRTSISKLTEPSVVLTPDEANFEPLSLSVDWLNMQLYILGEVKHATTVWQIARCGLDGRGLTVAVAGFMTKPSHIEVDPYNGYLFWVTKGGLFRLDLADVSNGIKHKVEPDLILEDSNLGAFMVDHRNFRLLVPHHVQNTVISVSLDGREISNLRNNTQQPKFRNVVSLAMANGLFYWTNGEEVLTEEYHPGQNRYFHNAYPSRSVDQSDSTFVSVNVFMDASQPAPVPVNPPTGVQAVFGAEMAKVSWQAPYLLGGQGKGAWQNWNYELEIRKDRSDLVIRQKGISGSSHTVRNLEERSYYSIKAAAYTSAGRGPWSTEFRGLTLRDPGNGSYASILWSATEGLLKSDVTGENVDTLLHKSSLKEADTEYHVVDVTWYRDMLYLVGNNSVLYSYNTTSHQKDRLNINSVGSVAVDWVSKKLYWANPKQQIITRANLNGTQPEPMSILAIVKELTIDSLEAYLYWSTGHAVEVARLNGQHRRCYHSDEIFNGKQVMGLTLDTERKFVYWIVRSYESGSILYRAPTSERIPWSRTIVPERVSALQHPNMQGPLCYFSEHLLWLQDDRNAVIGDLSGQNTAVINGITLSDLRMVAIMDHALHKYPSNLTADTIVVLPAAVDNHTIRVEGDWRNFNVSWEPVKNVNYGTVFYEVKFSDYTNTNSNPEITTHTTIPYNNSQHIKPYSHLEVTIKAFTYWGMAYHVRSTLRSPQTIPSEPTNARAFIEFEKEPMSDEVEIFAVFRWDRPGFPNGVILGYIVEFWYITNEEKTIVGDGINVSPNTFEYKVENLLANTTYGFQVQAYTKVGPGPFHDPVHVSTEIENPVPQILVATLDAVRLSDLDRSVNDTIAPHIVVEVAYSASEGKMFWINKDQEVVMADLYGLNPTRIVAVNSTAFSLCINWVTRSLFWAESGHKEATGGRIMRLDLTTWEAGMTRVQEIATRDRRIVNLDVSPPTGKLYWIEMTKHDRGVIIRSDVSGENVEPFFNHDEDCSCPYAPTVRPAMTVDNTDINNPVIYWISMEAELNIADIDGCVCTEVIGPGFNRGLPPTSLTVDKVNVYWSNIAEDRLYSVNKMYTEGDEVRSYHIRSARSLKAIGKSLQPYPVSDCLVPRHESYKVEMLKKMATSITVRLPTPEANVDCERYSLPATRYVLTVSEVPSNDQEDFGDGHRNEIIRRTFDREIEIDNLKPFTRYVFRVALTNYYKDSELQRLELGPETVFRTEPGAPTSPENVMVKALTPTSVNVSWQPPRFLNGPNVSYIIRWSSVELVNDLRLTGEQPIKWSPSTDQMSALLQPLLPGKRYHIYVGAYCTDSPSRYNESVGREVKLYPEPNNLTIIGKSTTEIVLSWVPNQGPKVGYKVEYSFVEPEDWKGVTKVKTLRGRVEFTIEGLQPKMMYMIRLVLRYPDYKHPYIWPSEPRFVVQTLGDVPGIPGVPIVTKLRGSVHQVSWKPAEAHGSHIKMYSLEGRIINDNGDSNDGHNETEWTVYYNGTDSHWIIPGEMVQKYRFRVRASNYYGFGAWSEPSAVFDLVEAGGILGTRQHLGLVLGLSVPLILGVMLLCFGFFLCIYRQRREDKKTVIPPTMPDVELATLREIPRGNFIQSNALYASALQNDPDDSMLPKIKREQITLAKFLGSGAFGEVFQGNARDLEGPGITRVAIKTLRKGASAQEKTEFLQEARLMSHFKHKHVLRLLGVCMDTDPPLLVLELMRAGDLLTYLRASRPLQPTDPSALRLQDLLAMCEDVARGCRYLEELHFVHRDLACRNCLVSARDRESRVVKIGDFGLARDIYKNDYYRKEGEGLLPVRWMAPESLVDGVFTSQSDVWSFGVLMWEITSLGQQPYPARTNLEVLHHVRAGGRLPKPLNCPPALHKLMLRCWSTADSRPSFKACLDHIINLRTGTEDATLSPVHTGHYVSKRGVSNMAYFADENQNHNDSGNSLKSSSSEGSRDMQPFLPDSLNSTVLSSPGDIPKYLEVLADNDGTETRTSPMGDYEVPRIVQVFDKSSVEPDDKEDGDRVTNKAECNKDSDGADSNTESRISEFETLPGESTSVRRSSATSLSSVQRSRSSLASVGIDKEKNSDDFKSKLETTDSPSLGELTRRDKTSIDGGSVTSLSTRSVSSLGSSTSLAVSTRPSSSLINSQISLPLKVPNGNKRNSLDGVNGKNTILKLQRTHSTLHGGKANIPLAINSALLNSLKQSPGAGNIDDSNEIVTYTNVNSEVVRINA